MRSLLILLLAPAVGCGGDADIAGIYQTQSAAFDTMSCDARTSTSTPPYFMVREGELLGVTLQTIRACTAADVETCTASQTFSEAPLTLGSSDGWEGAADGASGFDGSPCLYSHAEVSALQADDGTLTVVALLRQGERASSACDAEDVPDDLPCVAAQSVVGKKVADVAPGTGLEIF